MELELFGPRFGHYKKEKVWIIIQVIDFLKIFFLCFLLC